MSTTAHIPCVSGDPVLSWRLERLEAAGYPPDEALLLCERVDVDLHLATRLIENGCSPTTAARILL